MVSTDFLSDYKYESKLCTSTNENLICFRNLGYKIICHENQVLLWLTIKDVKLMLRPEGSTISLFRKYLTEKL